MINIIKQKIPIGKSNLAYIEPYKRIVNNIMFLIFNYSNDVLPFQLRKQFKGKNKLLKIFLVFLAIILGFLLTTSIRLILDKK